MGREADNNRERVDCDQLVETVIFDLQEGIAAAGASVTHDRLPTLTGVRTELRQLFANLIGNAVKFHGDQPVRVHVGSSTQPPLPSSCPSPRGSGQPAAA